MVSHDRPIERLPASTWIVPGLAGAWLAAKITGLLPATSSVVVTVSAILLITAVFVAVYHAEVIALKVGEPFGTLVLALAVTVIEASLIVSVMFSGGAEASLLARDTVFATIMIVCNGVLGLALLIGGLRHHVVTFRAEGTTPAVAVLATLATLVLVLPQFTLASEGPTYSLAQLAFAGTVSLLLYAVYIFVQTVRHRDYFLPEGGDAGSEHALPPSPRATLLSLGLLIVALVAVFIFLAMVP